MHSLNHDLPEPVVYVIDDDADVRRSLTWLLDSVQLPVQSFASALEFLESPLLDAPACIVLDIRMRGMSGLQLQSHLQQQGCAIPIIFMTGHGDIAMSVQAMRAGAFDFLEKPFHPQQMLNQIQNCLQHAEAIYRAQRTQQQQQQKLQSLSPREREIMALLVEGYASKVIAQKLNISHKTVEIHRAHIRQKLGTESIAHLVNLALSCNSTPLQLHKFSY